MYRILIALALAGVLTACTSGNPTSGDEEDGVGTGTQPLTDEEMPEDVPDEGSDDSDNKLFASDLNDDLTLNDVEYDPDTDELVLNNLPFDGEENLYAQDAAQSANYTAAGSGFQAYRNVGGTTRYYAVFRETDHSRVAAAGTDNYITFGYGGMTAQRRNENTELDTSNEEYLFTGEYAAIRTVIDPDTGSEVQYVVGSAIIRVDLEDFDGIGAVDGFITDRTYFDSSGVAIAAMGGAGDYISLALAEINYENWTINDSDATHITDLEEVGSGTWEGLFTGPNGEEAAGIVFVEGTGPIRFDAVEGEYVEGETRENGVFITAR